MPDFGKQEQSQATPATIVIVEDEDDLRVAVEEYLASHDYRVIGAANAQAFREIAATTRVDVAILDIAMPGEDGLSLARWIRSQGEIGIIFATASGKPIDRIVGLESGADDYIVKPYGLRELLARIKGLLRRMREQPASKTESKRNSVAQAEIVFGPFRLDTARRSLERRGSAIALTSAEFDLLEVLAARPGRVLSRGQIADILGSAAVGERAVDTAVTRLRGKIEDDPADPRYIRTVRGEGYAFTADRS